MHLIAEAASLALAQNTSQASQTPPHPTRTAPACFSSPKMKMMVGSGSPQSALKQGYYGPIDFFDNQANFHAVFGNWPGILCFMPLRTDMADVVKGQLRAFCDKCKLEIFLSITQLDYVGADSDVDASISTIAVCRQIKKLSQEIVENGQPTFLSTELLANQFTSLTTTLQNYQWKTPNELISSRDVPSIFDPVTKLSYPFNSDLDYVSKYPVGFKGCFTCASEAHWKSDDCPKVQSGQSNKRAFFKELWTHKPWLKKKKIEKNSNKPPSQDTPSYQPNVQNRGQNYYSRNNNDSSQQNPPDNYPNEQNRGQNYYSRNNNDSTQITQKNEPSSNDKYVKNDNYSNDNFSTQQRSHDNFHNNSQQCSNYNNQGQTVLFKDEPDPEITSSSQQLIQLSNTSFEPPPHLLKTSQHTGQRSVTNKPSWMTDSDWNNYQQCPPSKRGRLFVYFGQIYLNTKSHQHNLIPLPITNNLPAIEIQFG